MRQCLVEAPAPELQQAPLHFDPGIGTHFLGRDLVFGFGVQRLGAGGIAGDGPQIRDAREDVPEPVFPDDVFVFPPRILVFAVLQIEIRPQRLDPGAAGRSGRNSKIVSCIRQPVKCKVDMGPEEIEVWRRTDLPDGVVDRRFGDFEVGEVSGERGATIKEGDQLHRFLDLGGRRRRAVLERRNVPVELRLLDFVVVWLLAHAGRGAKQRRCGADQYRGNDGTSHGDCVYAVKPGWPAAGMRQALDRPAPPLCARCGNRLGQSFPGHSTPHRDSRLPAADHHGSAR